MNQIISICFILFCSSSSAQTLLKENKLQVTVRNLHQALASNVIE